MLYFPLVFWGCSELLKQDFLTKSLDLMTLVNYLMQFSDVPEGQWGRAPKIIHTFNSINTLSLLAALRLGENIFWSGVGLRKILAYTSIIRY